MYRFVTADEGCFINPETGECVPVEDMMKGDNNENKD